MYRQFFFPRGAIICPSPVPYAPVIVIKELLRSLFSRMRQKTVYVIVQNAFVISFQELAREYRCTAAQLDAICTQMRNDGVFTTDFYLEICPENCWLDQPTIAKALLKSRLRQYFA